MKSVCITGTSTGIGYAAAKVLITRGYRVFGSVRSEDTASRLQQELGGQFVPLVFDVTDHDAIQASVEVMKKHLQGQYLAGLVNNAGISVPGPLQYLPLEQLKQQFEVNLFGQFDVIQQFLPLLGAEKEQQGPPGRIINISSVSGKIAYPFMGAYAASKFAFEALSDALRRELLMYGIKVIVIGPGTIKTPIVDKFRQQIEQYRDTNYHKSIDFICDTAEKRKSTGIPIEKITSTIQTALEASSPKVRYAIPRGWLTSWFLPRVLPSKLVDYAVAKVLKIKE